MIEEDKIRIGVAAMQDGAKKKGDSSRIKTSSARRSKDEHHSKRNEKSSG